jgi:hypothetical protein
VSDGSSVEAGSAEGLTSEYIVVLRALSSARFLPEEGWEFHLGSVAGLGLGAVRVRTFTRWVAIGGDSVPRELIVEVRGRAGSLDEAAGKFQMIASPVAAMIGFTADVRVGPLEVHLAYECTAGATERQFLEVFVPDERGAVTDGRFIRRDLLEAACLAFFALDRTYAPAASWNQSRPAITDPKASLMYSVKSCEIGTVHAILAR